MRPLKYLPFLFVALMLAGCDALVEDVIDPIDSADDTALTDADEIDFLISGVQARFANVTDNATVQASLLSDQFIFAGGIGGGATFPTFRDLDIGAPTLDNNSVDGTQNFLGQYLYLADDLVERVSEVDQLPADDGGFADDDDPARLEALFTGYFHGGIARYYWATYFGLNERQGGGVISPVESPADSERGDFTPSSEMYQLALNKLNEALAYANEYESRVVHTLEARIHLFQNNLEAAEMAAQDGMVEGDAPFQARYVDRASNQANGWFSQGGPGRTQTVSALRFFYDDDYLGGDLSAPESARIPLFDGEDVVEIDGEEFPVWAQALYMSRDTPIDFATWQENELMLAEIEERTGTGDPTSRLNPVRAASGLDSVDNVDLDYIYLERDKELFTQGLRLPDQRRAEMYNLDVDPDQHYWHLADDTWWYLPITLDERNDNPNID